MLRFAYRSFSRSIIQNAIIGASLFSTAVVWADEPTAAPRSEQMGASSVATAPSAAEVDIKPLMADVKETSQKLSAVLIPGVLSDPTKRSAAAPEALPLLKKIQSDFAEVIAAKPAAKHQLASGQLQATAMLSTLGDKPSTDALQEMSSSSDAQQAIRGQSGQLLARWYGTKDPGAQTIIVNDLEKLDRANPNANNLTMLTLEMSRDAATPDLHQRMLTMATDDMTSPAAVSVKQQLKAAADKKAAADAELAKVLDKPLTIAGTTPDGKPFTTADLKGKVVLIDFWATWCAPCRAELPQIKELYAKYHDQGFEIVGVSNDFDVEKLKSFVVEQQMPWSELFDADAASDNQWSRITLGFGIRGIPQLFLIDKKGVARSVMALDDIKAMIPKLLADVS